MAKLIFFGKKKLKYSIVCCTCSCDWCFQPGDWLVCHFSGPVGNFPSAGTVNGTCITRKAQKGEMCDTDCRCDVGKHNSRYTIHVYWNRQILILGIPGYVI